MWGLAGALRLESEIESFWVTPASVAPICEMNLVFQPVCALNFGILLHTGVGGREKKSLQVSEN